MLGTVAIGVLETRLDAPTVASHGVNRDLVGCYFYSGFSNMRYSVYSIDMRHFVILRLPIGYTDFSAIPIKA